MSAYQAGRQLEALGDGTRRAIFERIASGPAAVVDIARELPVSRPAVSQHLKVLKDVGLVTDRAEGTRRVYQLDHEGLGALRSYFDRFWSDALDSFRIAAEASPEGAVRRGKRPVRRRAKRPIQERTK